MLTDDPDAEADSANPSTAPTATLEAWRSRPSRRPPCLLSRDRGRVKDGSRPIVRPPRALSRSDPHPADDRSRDKGSSQLARRLLVESAWHYARQPRVGATLANRQQGQPEHVLQISNRAQLRLHRVYTGMRARGKPHNLTVVACARELACFLWAAATAP